MNIDQTLRDKLKNMPHIEPQMSRETFRSQVLAEVERRERQPKKPRRFVLPTVFAAAVVVFMFMVMSPWMMQRVGDDTFEVGRSDSEFSTMSGVESGEESAAIDAGSSTDEQGDSQIKNEKMESDTGQNETGDPHQSSHESVSEGVEESSETRVDISQALAVEAQGQVTREIAIEGFQEQVAFDRYILQPYGLQILIPVMPGGEKWFNEPQIDEGASRSVVFASNVETLENGELLLSSITVTANDDKSPAEVKEEQIATEEENAKEIGYPVDLTEEKLLNGERLIFFRPLQNADGKEYGYVREAFITEQNGRTFVFHIGRNEETSDGWGPRLTEVVYPELKVIQ